MSAGLTVSPQSHQSRAWTCPLRVTKPGECLQEEMARCRQDRQVTELGPKEKRGNQREEGIRPVWCLPDGQACWDLVVQTYFARIPSSSLKIGHPRGCGWGTCWPLFPALEHEAGRKVTSAVLS